MTTSNHHYPPNSTLMSKTTHQQQQYIIPMHHTNIFHIPFFSLQQASVTANTSLIHFLLVPQQISCLHNIARPLSNIPYNRKINLASLFFFLQIWFMFNLTKQKQIQHLWDDATHLQKVQTHSTNYYHPWNLPRFFTLSHQSPTKTIQSVSLTIQEMSNWTSPGFYQNHCFFMNTAKPITTTANTPQTIRHQSILTTLILFQTLCFWMKLKMQIRKSSYIIFLNTIKHQFKYIHFFYQQILLMLKSVSNLKTIKRNTT